MDRREVVQRIIDRTKGKTYLEIGVKDGGTFRLVKAENKIGVDPVPATEAVAKILDKKTRYFEMASDDFFREKAAEVLGQKGLDVVLIDGLHEHKQVLRDVENCLRYLNPKGVIVLHDCNPATKEMQVIPWTGGAWTGDVWKGVVRLRSEKDDINLFVLDCDYGLGVITKGEPESRLNLSAQEIERLKYEDLESKRQELLNLKAVEYFSTFLESLSA